jgi:hypothetical protein
MSEHWNIQVNIQKVSETDVPRAAFQGGKPPKEKTVLQVADIKVQAETEAEAYERVQRLLTAVHPNVAVLTSDQSSIPARPVRDNPQA